MQVDEHAAAIGGRYAVARGDDFGRNPGDRLGLDGDLIARPQSCDDYRIVVFLGAPALRVDVLLGVRRAVGTCSVLLLFLVLLLLSLQDGARFGAEKTGGRQVEGRHMNGVLLRRCGR
jgi:hypothetical protein